MRTILCAALAFFCFGSLAVAATQQERPDQEMLKLMEILQQCEMIKNLELMRDLSRVEADTERFVTGSTKGPSGIKKGKAK